MSFHNSLDGCLEQVHVAACRVAVEGRYIHYKRPEIVYVVSKLAILEETDEVVVVYEREADRRLSFVRPLKSWLETVKFEGQEVFRFQKLL